MAQAKRKRKYKPKPRVTCDFFVRNEFHNTSYKLRTRYYKRLTPEQIKLCRRALCGIRDCQCGAELKDRGPQDFVIRVGFDLSGDQIITLEPLRGTFLQR